MSTIKTFTPRALDRLALTNRPKVVITEKLQHQIDFLHKKVGTAEWSGELITREVKTINDLDDWTIICEDIWLADVGSPGFTGYEVDKGGFKAVDIVDMYEAFPGLLDGSLKNHHIHTHHNMGAFFSGTDESQLEDRGCQSNYFMMLVVDFKKTYKAKVAFKADIKGGGNTSIHFANNNDDLAPLTLPGETERSVLVVMECDIVFEPPSLQVTDEFKARYEQVQTALEEEKRSRFTYRAPVYGKGTYANNKPSGGGGTNSQVGRNFRQQSFGNWHDNMPDTDEKDLDTYQSAFKRGKKGAKGNKKQKRIGEMTEKEWREHEREQSIPMSISIPHFELRHATAMLNAFIAKDTALNFMPVGNKLYNVDFELKTAENKEQWARDFVASLPDFIAVMFENKNNDEGHIEMMNKIVELLHPYMYTPLVRCIVEEVADEIVLLSDTLIEEDMEEEQENSKDMVAFVGDQDCEDALNEAKMEAHIENSWQPRNLMHTPPLDNSEEADDNSGWNQLSFPLEDDVPAGTLGLNTDQDWDPKTDPDYSGDDPELGMYNGIKTVQY